MEDEKYPEEMLCPVKKEKVEVQEYHEWLDAVMKKKLLEKGSVKEVKQDVFEKQHIWGLRTDHTVEELIKTKGALEEEKKDHLQTMQRAQQETDQHLKKLQGAQQRIAELEGEIVRRMEDTPTLFGYLRGVDIIAERQFHITGQPQTFDWPENGLRIRVPEGCLPRGTTDINLDVGVSLSGQFELPPNTVLVSAIYWLRSSEKLEKPITLELQHCVSLTQPSQCSQLRFIIAKCSQKNLPYAFQPLEGGTFTTNSPFGIIARSQFSGTGVVRDNHTTAESEVEAVVRYCGQQLLYRHPQTSTWTLRFVVIKNLPTFMTLLKKEYSPDKVQYEPFPFSFKDDMLSLDIDMQGTMLKDSHWKMIPLHETSVEKSELDTFSPGMRLPGFQLSLEWTNPGESPRPLIHPLILKGAKGAKGDAFFTILLSKPDLHLPPPLPTAEEDSVARISTVSSEAVLTLDEHFAKVRKALWPAMGKWKGIGIELGLSITLLNKIERSVSSEQSSQGEEYLNKMVTAWLDTRSLKPSWQKLVSALKDVTVEEEAVAIDIEETYLQ